MIRKALATDAEAIAGIYNHYVLNTTVSFENEAVSVEEMRSRIEHISASFPYFVDEEDGQIAGYCYAHPWKERVAYCHTLETTIYLSPQYQRRGIGSLLMRRLIEQCRADGHHALVACITGGNEGSVALHGHLGFQQMSLFREVGRKFGQWLDVVDMELIL